jgi:hypothetical protein
MEVKKSCKFEIIKNWYRWIKNGFTRFCYKIIKQKLKKKLQILVYNSMANPFYWIFNLFPMIWNSYKTMCANIEMRNRWHRAYWECITS